MELKGKNILVVGFGVSGQAAARLLKKVGARVAVADDRRIEDSLLPRDLRGLEFHWGPQGREVFDSRDLIVVSPGVPLTASGLTQARKKKIPILGEFGLAAYLLQKKKKTKMIAVTGTNGKSTTVTLIHKILKAGRKNAFLAGNIGTPLSEVCLLPKAPEWVVAEVSSYQLETLSPFRPFFRPQISVILNITPDHLDRYPSMAAYAAAKCEIFRYQGKGDTLIHSVSDVKTKKSTHKARCRKIGFPTETLYADEEAIFFHHLRKKEVYPLGRVKLVGAHNVENMMAAIAAARIAGVGEETVMKVLEKFEGLPHRTQFVRERAGVRYYEDSKGTNVDAAVKSLSGFSDGSVLLIAGGRDKGGSYGPLREMALRKAKHVILIGESRDKISAAMHGHLSVKKVETLRDAVRLAGGLAVSGDVVLLSPACSSFDQFKDYKERGELFQKWVREL